MDSHGNLIILETQTRNAKPIWSAKLLVPLLSPNASGKLLDTGNFILVHDESQNVLWQSFDYPTNTFLPYMKLGLNRKTGLDRFLTSWKSSNDPGTGNFTYRIDPSGVPQFFLYKNGAPLWRVGSWTGQRWSGVPQMHDHHFIINATYVNNADEVTIMNVVTDPTVFLTMVVDHTGHMTRSTWHAQEHKWIQFWYDPKEDCDNFNRCGANGFCDPYIADKPECGCLPGFETKYPRKWSLGDESGGCVRNHNVSTCQSGEGFVLVARVKTPDTSKARVDASLNLKACGEKCLKDCSCVAYTTANESSGSGCLTWHGDMGDTRRYARVGQDLYIRVDARELAKYANKQHGSLSKKGMIAIIVVSTLLVMLLIMVYIVSWFVKKQKQARRKHSKYPSTTDFQDSASIKDLESRQSLDLPFFDLSDIAVATNRFSPDNLLGQGGFGSVYKGVLSNGMAIAVKKLSISSGQGIEEFKNEVALIAKLQHRNLVRILGYCIQGQEKMLIYEYLPNKSLDSYIFDKSKRLQLDWKKRKNSGHNDDITSSTLVGHIWDLWSEGRAMEIVDPSLGDTCLDHEVLRCIQIGLLCVQDYPKERPTISVVISMLDNYTNLATPKQPVFSFTRTTHYTGINSVNGMSITVMEGR
ncbi:hypothetical protein L6164_036498 [Bauhinia variegata]|uniref:Uncharacterized protein n=1 Tax=Bauhinia variegata TaxID=167791 RepID=A0ACB9KH62_BAUVA|nr:hypothetical protein L6164_036498 [Bauhinia variegata]